MREIKFRAWDLVTKTMQDVPAIFYASGEKLKMVNMSENRRFEFMQYTGLKDKNGVEVWEGDILQPEQFNLKPVYWHGCGGERAVVAWEDNVFGWVLDFYTMFGGEGYEQLKYFKKHRSDWVIIGNIYENPELLKEVENG